MDSSASSPSSSSFAETLAARGIRPDFDRPLDATISAAPQAVSLSASLPPISLTFPGGQHASSGKPSGTHELEVLSLLGEGGMGSVYLARQSSLGREVAIKTTRVVDHAQMTAALLTEARIAGQLEHPGIVPVHQLAVAPDGRPVMVMKRVEGTTWRELMRDAAHPAWQRLRVPEHERAGFHLEVLARLCEAVAFVHSRGFVHRDIKPENVMLGAFGEVYLLDWGLAMRAGTPSGPEQLVGTPVYMAPEMVAGPMIDTRTDVYLLGATLHEVLTGAPPHSGETIHHVLMQAFESRPKTYGDDVDPELASICQKAMSRDPDDRFSDGEGLREALRSHANHRASRALSRRADERLADLQSRTRDGIDPQELPPLYALLAECRFGYEQARREWPENEAVPRGLGACHEAAVRIEIARRNPQHARAELTGLAAQAPGTPQISELSRAIEDLEAELLRERAELARVRELADSIDPSRHKNGIFTGLVGALVTVMVTVWILARAGHGAVSALDVLGFSLLAAAIVVTTLLTVGRTMWSNPFGRRLALWALIAIAIMVYHRFLAYAVLDAPVEVTLFHDLLLVGAGFLTSGIWSLRVLAATGAALLVVAGAAALFPERAFGIFAIGVVLAVISLPLAAWRERHMARQKVERGP